MLAALAGAGAGSQGARVSGGGEAEQRGAHDSVCFELTFQGRYGAIRDYEAFGKGFLMVAFATGYFVVVRLGTPSARARLGAPPQPLLTPHPGQTRRRAGGNSTARASTSAS